jgi:hypothetical protein
MATNGVNEPPIMAWDDWPKHPTWKTERQHVQDGLVPGGEPVTARDAKGGGR